MYLYLITVIVSLLSSIRLLQIFFNTHISCALIHFMFCSQIVFFSENRKFLYYDDDRIKGAYKDFQPPTKKMLLYFKNFSELMVELDRADNGSRAYFQVYNKMCDMHNRPHQNG